MTRSYPDLISAGKMVKNYGGWLKFLGKIWAVAFLCYAIWSAFQAHISFYWRFLAFILPAIGGLVPWLILHTVGIFLGAVGDSLLALADIATNSWHQAPGRDPQPPGALYPHGVFELAGSIFCNNCRHAVTSGVAHECGSTSPVVPPLPRCSGCGEVVDSGTAYCGNCGQKLR